MRVGAIRHRLGSRASSRANGSTADTLRAKRYHALGRLALRRVRGLALCQAGTRTRDDRPSRGWRGMVRKMQQSTVRQRTKGILPHPPSALTGSASRLIDVTCTAALRANNGTVAVAPRQYIQFHAFVRPRGNRAQLLLEHEDLTYEASWSRAVRGEPARSRTESHL
jgi:hypothetical protein